MKIGIIRETFPGERRVAMVPKAMDVLAKSGVEFVVEASAGLTAGFRDEEYRDKGAGIERERAAVVEAADIIFQVRTLGANPVEGRADLDLLREGQTVIGFCEALAASRECTDLAAHGLTTFAMELMPRITRAQSMDALSSMATVAGYRAVLLAAEALPRLFPMLMTAAGTITPARVFVLGAGVAGLQAIATARRLGAVVSGYDLRPAVREQVESLGAKFVQLPMDGAGAEDKAGYAKAMGEDFYRRQRDLIAAVAREQDVIITTAAVPGQKAPVLITADMVRSMAAGSVVVDLAAERGGNCELTRAGETVFEHGVTVLGPLNLASAASYHSSQMYARNIATFCKHLIQNGKLTVNFDDEITRETLVTYGGEILHPRVRQAMGLGPAAAAELVGKGS